MIVFDDVEIPWENVFFYRHTKAAAFIRATLHRYSIFPFVQRYLRFADLLLGVAYASARSDRREDAPGRAGEARRARLLPRGHQRPPDRGDRAGRAEPGRPADAQPAAAVHGPGTRLLPAAGGSCTSPATCAAASCASRPTRRRSPIPRPGRWLEKYLAIGEIAAEDRRKLFAFARDLLNSDYAGHRLTFQLFAQSPPFSHLLAVYNNYDFDGPLDLVRAQSAGLSDAMARCA